TPKVGRGHGGCVRPTSGSADPATLADATKKSRRFIPCPPVAEIASVPFPGPTAFTTVGHYQRPQPDYNCRRLTTSRGAISKVFGATFCDLRHSCGRAGRRPCTGSRLRESAHRERFRKRRHVSIALTELHEDHLPVNRVLMIAFHYPPCGTSSGLQRTLAFTRYLNRYGWMPAVVTASPRAYEALS